MSTDLLPGLDFPTAENRSVRTSFLRNPTPRKARPAEHGCGTKCVRGPAASASPPQSETAGEAPPPQLSDASGRPCRRPPLEQRLSSGNLQKTTEEKTKLTWLQRCLFWRDQFRKQPSLSEYVILPVGGKKGFVKMDL